MTHEETIAKFREIENNLRDAKSLLLLALTPYSLGETVAHGNVHGGWPRQDGRIVGADYGFGSSIALLLDCGSHNFWTGSDTVHKLPPKDS